MQYAAGLDVGTTGCKIAVCDGDGNLVKTYYREYDAVRTASEHELDFGTVLSGVLAILSEAAGEYRISALGVTSFGESFTLVSESGEILTKAMLYTDPRGEAELSALTEKFGSDILTLKTGTKPHTMYSVSKLAYLSANNKEAVKNAKRVLLGEDFIVYSLTGNAQIDYSLAARTAAFDIEKKEWLTDVLSAAGISADMMSRPVCAGTCAGTLLPEIKKKLGIDYDITVVNGCHDQVAAMIGSGCDKKGVVMDGTGTVECMPAVLEAKPTDTAFYEKGYSVVPAEDGKYACYALSYTGGAALKWYRDNFAKFEKSIAEKSGENVYSVLDKSVGTEPTGILTVPYFAGAATPYMDASATATFTGITLGTTGADMYKALMEGTAYEMKLNFDMLKEAAGEVKEIRATGGGASSDVWLQIKADVLGAEIAALSANDAGAVGTAVLAGCAVGIYKDRAEALSKLSRVRKVFTPDGNRSKIYSELYKKYRRIYTAIKSTEDIQ